MKSADTWSEVIRSKGRDVVNLSAKDYAALTVGGISGIGGLERSHVLSSLEKLRLEGSDVVILSWTLARSRSQHCKYDQLMCNDFAASVLLMTLLIGL